MKASDFYCPQRAAARLAAYRGQLFAAWRKAKANAARRHVILYNPADKFFYGFNESAELIHSLRNERESTGYPMACHKKKTPPHIWQKLAAFPRQHLAAILNQYPHLAKNKRVFYVLF